MYPEVKVEKVREGALKVFPPELMGIIPEGVWAQLEVEQKLEILKQHHLNKYIEQALELEPNSLNSGIPLPVTSDASLASKVDSESVAPPTSVNSSQDDIEAVAQENAKALSSDPVKPEIKPLEQPVGVVEDSKASQEFKEIAQEIKEKNLVDTNTSSVEVKNNSVETEIPKVMESDHEDFEKQEDPYDVEEEGHDLTHEEEKQIESEQEDAKVSEMKIPGFTGYAISQGIAQAAKSTAKKGAVKDASTWAATLFLKLSSHMD